MLGGAILLPVATLVTLTPTAQVTLQSAELRLSDIAIVSNGAPSLGRTVVGRLAPGSVRTVSRRQLRALIARALPGVSVEGGLHGSITLRAAAAAPNYNTATCFQAGETIGEGVAVSRRNVVEIACVTDHPTTHLTFSSDGMVRAGEGGLPAGAYLGRVELSEAQVIKRGDIVQLRSSAGTATIERPVEAMQSASSRDRRVFVRGDDGEVFAAPLQVEPAR